MQVTGRAWNAACFWRCFLYDLRKRCMKGLGKALAPESVGHAEDIVFKAAGECFGEETMKLLHIPEKVRRVVPAETVRLEARRIRKR